MSEVCDRSQRIPPRRIRKRRTRSAHTPTWRQCRTATTARSPNRRSSVVGGHSLVLAAERLRSSLPAIRSWPWVRHLIHFGAMLTHYGHLPTGGTSVRLPSLKKGPFHIGNKLSLISDFLKAPSRLKIFSATAADEKNALQICVWRFIVADITSTKFASRAQRAEPKPIIIDP